MRWLKPCFCLVFRARYRSLITISWSWDHGLYFKPYLLKKREIAATNMFLFCFLLGRVTLRRLVRIVTRPKVLENPGDLLMAPNAFLKWSELGLQLPMGSMMSCVYFGKCLSFRIARQRKALFTLLLILGKIWKRLSTSAISVSSALKCVSSTLLLFLRVCILLVSKDSSGSGEGVTQASWNKSFRYSLDMQSSWYSIAEWSRPRMVSRPFRRKFSLNARHSQICLGSTFSSKFLEALKPMSDALEPSDSPARSSAKPIVFATQSCWQYGSAWALKQTSQSSRFEKRQSSLWALREPNLKHCVGGRSKRRVMAWANRAAKVLEAMSSKCIPRSGLIDMRINPRKTR